LAGERTLRLVIEYDGTRFHGWQVQKDVRTVQGELEAAFTRMTHESVRITGAGRTDAGVHALGQVASLTTDHPVAIPDLVRGLNALTGPDLAVLSIEEVDAGFSARFDASGKLYRYSILNRAEPSALRRHTHLHVRAPLDLPAMRDGAARLVGTHDFSAFRAADCEREDPTMTLTSVDVLDPDDTVVVEVRGPAFLKNMVRIIAGTLVEVGRGRLEPAAVSAALASRDRSRAGPTAPAHGLVLVEVTYGPRAAPSTSSMR
jgi:tRNA pseudouridine38-40 synthase